MVQVNDFVEFFSGDAKVSAALRNALASICCRGHWNQAKHHSFAARPGTQELLWTFFLLDAGRKTFDFCSEGGFLLGPYIVQQMPI